MSFNYWALVFLSLGLWSCTNNAEQSTEKQSSSVESRGRNKIYKGKLRIGADTGLESVIKQEVEIFTFIHDSVSVQYEFKNEGELLKDFKTSESSTVILTRELPRAHQPIRRP